MSASPTVPIIVDGKEYPSKQTYPVYDPQDRATVLHNVASLPVSAVADVVASSRKAFPAWRDTPYTEKRKIFLKAAELMRERTPELIGCQATETTSSAGFAGFDVAVLTTATLDETTAVMSTALRGEMAPLDASGKRMMVIKEPMGVVLSIGEVVRHGWVVRLADRWMCSQPPGTHPQRSLCVQSSTPWRAATSSFSRPASTRQRRTSASQSSSSMPVSPPVC